MSTNKTIYKSNIIQHQIPQSLPLFPLSNYRKSHKILLIFIYFCNKIRINKNSTSSYASKYIYIQLQQLVDLIVININKILYMLPSTLCNIYKQSMLFTLNNYTRNFVRHVHKMLTTLQKHVEKSYRILPFYNILQDLSKDKLLTLFLNFKNNIMNNEKNILQWNLAAPVTFQSLLIIEGLKKVQFSFHKQYTKQQAIKSSLWFYNPQMQPCELTQTLLLKSLINYLVQ
eukprot:TRINITY_DN35179_c0_g1_i1.p2 TRINITY_DN35179_c0_g1~~TRINITY_DN35179_c0_g1_i1.p2  ORF type:complete len:229 (-),score=-26.83 TRINITY_DN35179_c0_g1_i1:87-773(-)